MFRSSASRRSVTCLTDVCGGRRPAGERMPDHLARRGVAAADHDQQKTPDEAQVLQNSRKCSRPSPFPDQKPGCLQNWWNRIAVTAQNPIRTNAAKRSKRPATMRKGVMASTTMPRTRSRVYGPAFGIRSSAEGGDLARESGRSDTRCRTAGPLRHVRRRLAFTSGESFGAWLKAMSLRSNPATPAGPAGWATPLPRRPLAQPRGPGSRRRRGRAT